MPFQAKRLACAALCAFAAASAIAQESQPMQPIEAVPVVTVEGMTEYRLPNGLRIVLYPDAGKPTATVNMTYLVGSRHENYGETGMAHLLEHLMFKGSKNYPSPTAEFTKRGFRMNGSTWFDRTNYFVSFTATDDNMKWALGWQADAMTNSFIAQKDLDTEMTVVRNEFEMGENKPVSVMLKRMQSMMFDWHAYGRSTIGARSDIENVEIANLQAFYHRYYQPDNAVLTVSGKFDPEQVLTWIKEFFGPIPKPTRVLPKEWTVEPTADGEREFKIRRQGESQMVAVGYRIPAALHEDYEPTAMAALVLADTPSGVLYKDLVETGLATQVFAWPMATEKPGFVMFGALMKKDADIELVKTKLIDAIEHAFDKEGVPADKLELQKADQATMFERSMSDPENFAVGLSEYIALGDWRLFFADRDIVAAVTPEQATAAAKRYFVRDNRTVGLFIPTTDIRRAEIPTAPSAEDLLKNFTFKTASDAGEAFDVSQANIDARTEVVDVGGLKAALLPKKTRGNTVSVQYRFLNGNLETAEDGARSMMMGAMLTRGTAKHDRQQIDDLFTKLKMEGSPFGFTTDREHLADAIALSAELLTTSSFPEKEFETLRRQTIEGLQSRSDDPGVKARDELTRRFNTYPEGDARRNETSEELIAALKKLTLADVKKHYDEVFGTGRGFVAVVGDFDPTEVKKELSDKVAGVKAAKAPFERFWAEYRPVEPGRAVIDTPDKENAVLFARVDLPANIDDEDMPALIVADWVLGGSPGLSNRIVNRLRQKEGLSYGVSSNLVIPTFGNRAKWTIGAIVAPQNVLQAETSLKDELKKAFEAGITADELEEAKRGILQSRAVNRAQDGILASGWLSNLERNVTWMKSKETEDAIEALTVDQVNAAVRRLADPSKMVYVLSGDIAKAKAAGKDFSKAE